MDPNKKASLEILLARNAIAVKSKIPKNISEGWVIQLFTNA